MWSSYEPGGRIYVNSAGVDIFHTEHRFDEINQDTSVIISGRGDRVPPKWWMFDRFLEYSHDVEGRRPGIGEKNSYS